MVCPRIMHATVVGYNPWITLKFNYYNILKIVFLAIPQSGISVGIWRFRRFFAL